MPTADVSSVGLLLTGSPEKLFAFDVYQPTNSYPVSAVAVIFVVEL